MMRTDEWGEITLTPELRERLEVKIGGSLNIQTCKIPTRFEIGKRKEPGLHCVVGASGRVTLPVKLRRQLGLLKPAKLGILKSETGKFIIQSARQLWDDLYLVFEYGKEQTISFTQLVMEDRERDANAMFGIPDDDE